MPIPGAAVNFPLREAVSIALLAGACGRCHVPPTGDGGPGPGAVALGTGQLEWEPLDGPDTTVELVFGPQGGFHVWGRARWSDEAPDVDISFRVTRLGDGAELHAGPPVRRRIADGVRLGAHPVEPGRLQTDAELVILQLSCARDLVGERVRFELFVRDRARGGVASVAREARVIDEIPSPVGCVALPDAAARDASGDR